MRPRLPTVRTDVPGRLAALGATFLVRIRPSA